MKLQNNLVKIIGALVLALGVSMGTTGCALTKTYVPTTAKVTQPSFDGNKQDSGIISITAAGALVTSHFRDRYNALIGVYGAEAGFTPALVLDQGITPASDAQVAANPGRGQLYVIDDGSLASFLKMNRWKKMGRVPAVPAPKPSVLNKIINAVVP